MFHLFFSLLFSFLFTLPIYGITPDDALQRLIQGNIRYMNDKLTCPDRIQERRDALVSNQNPFVTILGCADSRVAPEIIFDQGIGDLFVVRVAGNVLGPAEQDSIDYAALLLQTPLIIVLGHENCGAIKAVLEGQTADIEFVADKIERTLNLPKERGALSLPQAVKKNVEKIVEQLKKRPQYAKLMEQNRLKIIGGYYQLTDGKVVLLE